MNAKRLPTVDIIMACVLYVLNIVDCFLTLWVLNVSSSDMELNPILRVAYDIGPWTFISFKLIIGALLTLALLFHPPPKRINYSLLFVTLVYFVFTFYHLIGVLGVVS